MKNLTIVQNWYTLCYATIQKGGYWFQVHKFELGWDYLYM
jgi:hypothetical protein